MTLMSILAASDQGKYFDRVAQVCTMSTAEAEAVLARLCPAIAARLKSKMHSDNNAFEALLELLDEGDDLLKRRATTPTLEDIFGQILGARK